MRAAVLVPLAVLVATLTASIALAAEPALRISGPQVHDNLAVYFLHGASTGGPVPLTLAEALETGRVRVVETGNVNALLVENLGQEAVFIQSGDIVKGGQQDRVLTVSLLLPAKSGPIPIDSFCVEQGRWAARGKEDVKQFSSAVEALPSRAAKLAMKVPPKIVATETATASSGGSSTMTRGLSPRATRRGEPDDTGVKQRKVWDEVANIQTALSSRLGAKVAAPQSATSLQLSLESDALKTARLAYIAALEKAPGQTGDIVGFVFAIDGKINSADVYPSSGLFQKMWPKLLSASVTEAIGARVNIATAAPTTAAPTPTAPSLATIEAFLAQAEAGTLHQASLAKIMTQETRDAEQSLYVEARTAAGAWVHRNYLAK
jgi:hypothetical protein